MWKAFALPVLAMGTLAVCGGAGAAQTATQAPTTAVAATQARAEQGDADAQYRLGRMYARGEGVPQDYSQAVAWFRKAAEQGNAKGQNGLGAMYLGGQGVPQDYAQAMAWFRRAAAQGEAMAQANLGVMYDNGLGVPLDYAQAAAWYRQSAEQGYAEAQYNIGVMFVDGQGVPQDYAQAVAWYRKAAEQGHAAAQFNLGRMYQTGREVPRDDVEAGKWFALAAARATGEDQKKFADGANDLAKSMTPAQAAESQRRAQEWTDAFEQRRTAAPSQAAAAPGRPTLQLAEVTVNPRAVRPGQPLSLEVAYTATDPAAVLGKTTVTMSFSILSGGSSLLDVPEEIVESVSDQPWKITKALTAATTPGTYLIRVRLALGAAVVTRDVEFEITR